MYDASCKWRRLPRLRHEMHCLIYISPYIHTPRSTDLLLSNLPRYNQLLAPLASLRGWLVVHRMDSSEPGSGQPAILWVDPPGQDTEDGDCTKDDRRVCGVSMNSTSSKGFVLCLQLNVSAVTGKASGENSTAARYRFQIMAMKFNGRDHLPRDQAEFLKL